MLFRSGPPVEEHNWRYSPGKKFPEVNSVQALVPQLREAGLTGEDLIITFISRRVSPLQRRVHKICHMSSNLDPTRTSTFELKKEAIRLRVKAIATVRMGEKWTWGLEPYSRSNPPPAVSNILFLPTSHTPTSLMPTSSPMSVYCLCLLMPTGFFMLDTEIFSPRDRGRL